MTICRKCGTSNKDGQKFCSFCHELLIADPVELAKREAAQKKKQTKEEKKQRGKRIRMMLSPILLIPMLILDVVGLVLGVDALAFGFLAQIITDNFAQDLGVLEQMELQYGIMGGQLLLTLIAFAVSFVLFVIMVIQLIRLFVYLAKKKKSPEKKETKGSKKKEQTQTQAQAQVIPGTEIASAAMDNVTVSYEVLKTAAGHRDDYTVGQTVKEIEISELYESLKAPLWEYDHASVRRILSAMSCSRLLLCSAGAIDSASIFDALTDAFSVKADLLVCEEPDADMSDLLLAKTVLQGTNQHTDFAKALYTARFSPENVCFAGVRGIPAMRTEQVFGAFGAYCKLPQSDVTLYMGKPAEGSTALPEGIGSGKLVLPQNLWLISVLPDDGKMPCPQGAIGEYCAVIYLRNSQYIFPPDGAEESQIKLPCVAALEAAVAAAEQQFCISEDLWKVIDAIEEQMQALCGKRLSNRTLRSFERYTSVFMACGGKQNEAFDNGLAAVILPGYAEQMMALAKKQEGETLRALLDRTVGRDRLPMTMEVLSSMELM